MIDIYKEITDEFFGKMDQERLQQGKLPRSVSEEKSEEAQSCLDLKEGSELYKIIKDYNSSHGYELGEKFKERQSCLEVGVTDPFADIINLIPEKGGGLWIIKVFDNNLLVPKLGYLDGEWARRTSLHEMFNLKDKEWKNMWNNSYREWELIKPATLVYRNNGYNLKNKGEISLLSC